MSLAPGIETTAAAERFLPGAAIEPVDGRSWLLSATTGDRRFSVRQLDPRLPAARIDIVQEFLKQPELRAATSLIASERVGTASFDARVWVDGATAGAAIPAADWRTLHLPASVEATTLGSIARALGEFHRSGTSTSLLARAPRFRVKDMLTQVRRTLELDERALGAEIRKESKARRWLTTSRVLLANAESNLERAEFLRDEPLVMAHLDLWGSHIVSESTSGPVFLDCATVSAAPAVVDLAQFLARNGAWSDDRVELALNAYTETNPIPPLQRRVLPWLTALDAIASCGNLLVRAHDERRPLSENDRRTVLVAADQQVDLLQGLASVFVPPPPRQHRRPNRLSGRS
ncbi:MAG: phosphotransferase [Thermomicrobiales bacterium]|nr:phosphotransferase [Thermomicrobiales bacterium]